jgi:gas vesicle protein
MSKEETGHHEEKKHGHGHGEGRHEVEYYSIKKGNLWLVAGGALGALAALGIGKVSKKIRPTVVGAVKEGYAFKEWVAGTYERAKEDVEDIVEEAKHAYHKDLEATVEAVKKEKEILKKVEEAVEKKTSKRKAKKED